MSGRLENEIKVKNKIEKKLKDTPSYVQEWYLYLRASNKTIITIKNYVNIVINYLTFIKADDIKNIKLSSLTKKSLLNYFNELKTNVDKNGNISSSSDSKKITTWYCLNNFFKYLYDNEYIKKNYVENINKPKNKDINRINNNRILLTKDDFNKIYNVVDDNIRFNTFAYRDKLILMLFMTTGMREEALLEIDIDDIDLEQNTITIIDKGNIEHKYPLNEECSILMENWIEQRKEIIGEKDIKALFISRFKNRLSVSALSNMVKTYSEIALGYPISPHKLRAGFCSILYNETHDAEFVRRAVGHSNISTTQRYIATDGKEKEVASDIISSIF